ncbi:kinase-like domain-containing protein [Irpex rosettiformis]|uniref:Kinase-like domain-containing protein n=1 Tax=Irpex rosettiformis TaxID=378272 RepID=A0ACB8U375_9APHY|nr:kinase-like domain-containing protein [Irpex rosettiformis]
MLGAGGFGCVIKARHRVKGHDVAFKFISKAQVPSVGWTKDEDGELVPLEIVLMKTAMHENIAKSLDVFQDNDFFYIGVEMHGSHWSVPTERGDQGGCSLQDYIDARGVVSEDHARYIFGQLVEAIHYLRSIGISHGDIKPDNALIDSNLKVKLIDFGNAVWNNPSLPLCQQIHSTDYYCGTVLFMPPECFESTVLYYPSADVWSLGILLIRILTGSLLFLDEQDIVSMNWRFQGEWAIERWRALSDQVKHLVGERCLARGVGSRALIEEVREHPWLVGWRGVGEMMEVVKGLKMAENSV